MALTQQLANHVEQSMLVIGRHHHTKAASERNGVDIFSTQPFDVGINLYSRFAWFRNSVKLQQSWPKFFVVLRYLFGRVVGQMANVKSSRTCSAGKDEEWRYSSIQIQPRHETEVNGKHNASAALSQGVTVVSIEVVAGWVPDPV